MATCVVSGTFLDPSNTAISGATVSFTIEQPVLDASANLLLPKTLSTTTASDGTWSLTIAQSVSGIITLDVAPSSISSTVKYPFSVIIPASSTATFQSVWADASNLTPVGNLPVSFASITGTLLSTQMPTLTGDVTNVAFATTVNTVGASTAANIHTAEQTINTAQSGNKVLASPSNGSSGVATFRALVGGDLPNPSSSSLGGVQSAAAVSSKWINSISTAGVPSLTTPSFNDLSGTVTTSQLPNLTLTGDVTGTLVNATGATTVALVGGSSASLVHSAELLANAATNLNTASAIVKRDSSGNFSAGTITAALSGNASTATTATSATTATTSTNATNVATTAVSTNASFFPLMVASSSNGNQAASLDASGITYNPSTHTLTTTTFSGALSGNATNVTGTVAVTNGGTGTNSLTSNAVVLGNGSSAVQFVAAGTSGNILADNGSTWVSQPPGTSSSPPATKVNSYFMFS